MQERLRWEQGAEPTSPLTLTTDLVTWWTGGQGLGLSVHVGAGSARGRSAMHCDEILGEFPLTQLPLSPSSVIWYRQKLEGNQVHRATHWPSVRGVADSESG